MTMTENELKQVLTKIQLGDNRQIDRLVALEWLDNIGDLDVDDCLAAVRMHRHESTDYLMPAHIRSNVRRIRNERALRGDQDSIAGGPHRCPKPDNWDALCAAWRGSPTGPRSDPAQVDVWLRQVAIYNQQLADAGHPCRTSGQ